MTYSFADASTGMFVGRTYQGPDQYVRANTAPGHVAVPGLHDPCRSRAVFGADDFGELLITVVDHRPAAPDTSPWCTWAWDETAWTWVAVPTADALARDARAERDRRLAACDWTQARDIPAATAERWQPYRQALRDISAQPGFPIHITWPQEPTT